MVTAAFFLLLGPARAGALPDLVEADVTLDRAAIFTGMPFTVSDRARNVGGARAGASTTRYFLSVDRTKGPSDRLLGGRLVPKVAAGGSNAGGRRLRVPIGTRTRRYYVLACSDARRRVRERREGNNCTPSATRLAVRPIVTSPLPASTGQVFYVATDGSDSNPGTLDQPWRTVQKALDTLQPGQSVRVRDGIYEQNLVMRRAGTRSNPITIQNYPGERPVLRPAATSPSYALRLTTGTAFVRFRGLVLENARGFHIQNVYGAGSRPGAHDYEISGCEIRNARNTGMFIDNTNYHVYIVGNLVHDNNEAGVQHQGIYIEASDSLVANNIVYHHTQGFGIQVRTDARRGPTGVVVSNNTVSNNSLGGILVEHTARYTSVVNNISAFNGGTGIRGYYSNEDHAGDPIGKGNRAFHNLVFGNGGYGNLRTDRRAILAFFDNVGLDPLFTNTTARDYHVLPGSPAIDAGVAAFAPSVDYDGSHRPQGAAPDLGAFER